VLELQGVNRRIIRDHLKTVRLATYRTWILPSSRRLGFLHLTIHVRFVRGHIMLIKCCFAIVVRWIPSILPQAGVHSSSRWHLVLFIMFSCSTLISTQIMPHFYWLKSGGGYMTISSQPPFVHCICMCVHSFWLISFYF
jgi:hypothetical protein